MKKMEKKKCSILNILDLNSYYVIYTTNNRFHENVRY